MPSAEIELDDGNESLGGIVHGRNPEKHFGVAHEAAHILISTIMPCRRWRGDDPAYLVILSSMLRGSKMKVGKTTRLRSAPGLSWEMMCDKTTWRKPVSSRPCTDVSPAKLGNYTFGRLEASAFCLDATAHFQTALKGT